MTPVLIDINKILYISKSSYCLTTTGLVPVMLSKTRETRHKEQDQDKNELVD